MTTYPNLTHACQDPFDISALIAAAKVNMELEELLEASAQVWEGYTVEEHSTMVLKMFERFWAQYYSVDEKIFWRLFMLLHDIGKKISVDKYGTKDFQHETTWPVMEAVLRAAQLSEQQIRLAHALLSQDILGTYFKDKATLAEATTDVLQLAQSAKVPADKMLSFIKMFFCCDAGAYSKYAGGCYSLDYMFEVDLEKNTMELSNDHEALRDKPEYRDTTPLGKYQLLKASVTASMAGSVL